MQRLTRLKEEVERWTRLEGQITTLAELAELAEAEADDSLREDVAVALPAIVERLEIGD